MIILLTALCCFYNLSMAACNHAVHTYAGAKGRPIAGKKAIPNPPQKLLYNMVLLWVSTLYTQQPCTPGYTLPEMDKKKEALDLQGLQSGGDSWTRTNDPIDVNDVHWATGQVVKLKCGREHTWKAFKIKAFSIFGGVQWKGVQGCSGGVHGPGV